MRSTSTPTIRAAQGRSTYRQDGLSSRPPDYRKGDPLVYIGHHLGRTVYTFCHVQTLLMDGLLRLRETNPSNQVPTQSEARNRYVFNALLEIDPGLKERLLNGTDKDLQDMAALIQRGVNQARANNTSDLKEEIVAWIAADEAEATELAHKPARGYKHNRTGELLCPSCKDWSDPVIQLALRDPYNNIHYEEAWPKFLYEDEQYNLDNPWKGFLKNEILLKAFRLVFFGPSASGNRSNSRSVRPNHAQLNDMKEVTLASMAYMACLVKFSLLDANKLDGRVLADCAKLYDRILYLLSSKDHELKVDELLKWWNRQVFGPRPTSVLTANGLLRPISALAAIKARRACLNLGLMMAEINADAAPVDPSRFHSINKRGSLAV